MADEESGVPTSEAADGEKRESSTVFRLHCGSSMYLTVKEICISVCRTAERSGPVKASLRHCEL